MPRRHRTTAGTRWRTAHRFVAETNLGEPDASRNRRDIKVNPQVSRSLYSQSPGSFDERPGHENTAGEKVSSLFSALAGRIQPVMATLNSPTIQRRPPLVSSTLAFYEGGR